MTGPAGSQVYLAMPVYRGTGFVAETLRSMLGQTHRDIAVMISVDGNDTASAEACAPFLSDERVRMEVQPRQLGWVANMNWLIDAFDGDFFCYWQQDDHCEPTYLEKLVAAIDAHPGAAAAHSDLRWFGDATDEVALPSIVGFTQQRILAQIEALHWLPLRAVVTADALRRVAPIRGLADSIAFSDYLFVLRLAMAGDLVRVPEVLYHKRGHGASASKNPSGDLHLSAREAWIELGLEIFSEVAPHFEEGDWHRLAAVIADRLRTKRPGRWVHYDAAAASEAEPDALARDFVAALEARHGVSPSAPRISSPAVYEPAAGWGPGTWGGATLDSVEDLAAAADLEALLDGLERRSLVEVIRSAGRHTLDCSTRGPTEALFLEGWSHPEDWGTWSDGPRALLWLPVPNDGARWRVHLVGQGYADPADAPPGPRIIVSHGERLLLERRLAADSAIPAIEVQAVGVSGGVVLRIDMPDAIAPSAHGQADDHRLLTLGLERIELARVPRSRLGWAAGRAFTRIVGGGPRRVGDPPR